MPNTSPPLRMSRLSSQESITSIPHSLNGIEIAYSINKMETPPRFKVGDTICWYCDKEQKTHKARVDFVNYVQIGHFYDDINYEVEVVCCGEKKTMFIDECDAMPDDL